MTTNKNIYFNIHFQMPQNIIHNIPPLGKLGHFHIEFCFVFISPKFLINVVPKFTCISLPVCLFMYLTVCVEIKSLSVGGLLVNTLNPSHTFCNEVEYLFSLILATLLHSKSPATSADTSKRFTLFVGVYN